MRRKLDPLVSVVIPTYNRETLIAEALVSVMTQTLQNWEALVVDDGSNDSTSEIVRNLALRDPRIRYIRMNRNSGLPSVGRNRGIRESRGSYVAFLDSDDLWAPLKLERQVDVLESDLSIGMVHSHLWVMRNGKRAWGLPYLPAPKPSIANAVTMTRRNMIQCSSVLIRKSILIDANGFDESQELRAVEDYHLWFRVSQKTRIAFISEIHGSYRWSKTGTSSLENMQQRLKIVDGLLGTQAFGSQRSNWEKVAGKLLSLPAALYFVVIEGTIRKRKSRKPRIWG